MNKKNRRTIILPSFQLRLTGFLALVVVIGSLFHGFFIHSITAKEVGEAFVSEGDTLSYTWEVMRPAVLVTNGISVIFLCLLLFIQTVIITHRMMGPMTKISGRLKEISDGKLSSAPVKLRRGDEGKMLSDAVNRMQGFMFDKFTAIKAIRDSLESETSPDIEKLRASLDAIISDIQLKKPEA